jgi:hypothetical protein
MDYPPARMTKHEARISNPKQSQNPNFKCSKQATSKFSICVIRIFSPTGGALPPIISWSCAFDAKILVFAPLPIYYKVLGVRELKKIGNFGFIAAGTCAFDLKSAVDCSFFCGQREQTRYNRHCELRQRTS